MGKVAELDERRFAAALEGDAVMRADAAAVLVGQGDYERAERLLAPLFDDWAGTSGRDEYEHKLNMTMLDESRYPFDLEQEGNDCLLFVTEARISALMAECVAHTRSYGSSDFQVRQTCRYLLKTAADRYSGAVDFEVDDENFEDHPLQHEAALGAIEAARAYLRTFVEHPEDDVPRDRFGNNHIYRLIGNPPPELVRFEQTNDYPLTRAWVAYIVESRDLDEARDRGQADSEPLRFRQLMGDMVMLDRALKREGYAVSPALSLPVCERLGDIINELEASEQYDGLEVYRREMVEWAKRHLAD